MKITRRQFGIALIVGMLGILLGRFLSIFRGEAPRVDARHVTARHWTTGDHLAG